VQLSDAEDICSRIGPRDPLAGDRRMTSQKIKVAKEILNDRAPSTTRDRALERLERASTVIEPCSATLHG
jgi:hypothetical protein